MIDVLSDRVLRWIVRAFVAAVVVLLLVNVSRAVGVVRPATYEERWVVDRAARMLVEKGVPVPPLDVYVNDDDDDVAAATGVARGVQAYAYGATVTLTREAAASGVVVWRAASRPARRRFAAYMRSEWDVIGLSYTAAIHEVVHVAQWQAGTIGCRSVEAVASAVALDWAGWMIRRRFGRVPLSVPVTYPELLVPFLAASGESPWVPTAYAGRARRLEQIKECV